MEPVHHRKPRTGCLHAVALLTLAVVFSNCDSGDEPPLEENEDGGLRQKPITEKRWAVEQVADGNVGLFTRLALVEDQPAVAYFAYTSRTGDPCSEIGSPNPPLKQFWDLYYASKSQGSWRHELVTDLLVAKDTPSGLDMKTAPDGTAAIASLTGEPIGTATLRYCGANDVGYFRRSLAGDWSVQTAVRSSGEAAVTGDTAAASNHGEVVGFWPALAYDRDGNAAIAYRDVHTGVLQSDDWRRADLELAMGSAESWRAVAIDWGRSAGEYNRLVFDQENRPVVLYYIPEDNSDFSQQGLWVARSSDGGASWQKVRLFANPVPLQPDIAVDRSAGNLYIVYYNENSRIIYLATLVDDAAFESASQGWSFTPFGDNQYDEGRYSSIALDPRGRIGVAYYRCGKTNETEGVCSSLNNALVFAWREAGGAESWTVEVVDEGEQSGECGSYASLAFGNDGAAYIAYLCQHVVDEKLESRVHLAKRNPL
ncbi:MAG: hypothetical protein JXA30_22840 [Deltaproteobacteria bacterium]|nr:hypothetical protein [Deltaproteobacteria bacterium]